ncbi:MAG: hypothetical protein ACKO3T_15950 [Planctomycetaceae bacterium]
MLFTLLKKLLGLGLSRSGEIQTPKQADELPTEKQLSYARKLGIAVSRNMTRRELSREIEAAESRSPQIAAARKRQAKKREAEERARQDSPEWRKLQQIELEWSKYVEAEAVLLLKWRQKSKSMVDVVMVDCVEIDDSGEPFVELTLNRPEKTAGDSEFDTLDWGREFSISVQDVISVQSLASVNFIELQWKQYKAILAAAKNAGD